MSIELPLYQQEKPKTCALACLRMTLAAFGIDLEERVLEAEASMLPGGTLLEEIERLANRHNLIAEIREATVEDLRQLLTEDKAPIAYIDRAIFDLAPSKRARHSLRHAKIHAVIPTRITRDYITYHDPLPPRVTRRTIRLFERAHAALGSYCLVCSRPPESEKQTES